MVSAIERKPDVGMIGLGEIIEGVSQSKNQVFRGRFNRRGV